MGHYLIHISHSFIRTFTALARSKHSDKIVLTFSIQVGRINGNKNMPSTFPDNIYLHSTNGDKYNQPRKPLVCSRILSDNHTYQIFNLQCNSRSLNNFRHTCTIIQEVIESSLPMCALHVVPTSILSFQICNNRSRISWSSWLFPKKCLVNQGIENLTKFIQTSNNLSLFHFYKDTFA